MISNVVARAAKMDPDFYDEFGNYIGPELESDDEDSEDESEQQRGQHDQAQDDHEGDQNGDDARMDQVHVHGLESPGRSGPTLVFLGR